MNFKTTFNLVVVAAGLIVLIWFVERPIRESNAAVPQKTIFPGLDPKEVTGVHVHPAGRMEIRAERSSSGWQIIKPISYRADATRVETLLEWLARLEWRAHVSAQDLKDRRDAQEEFGFDAPQLSILIQRGETRNHLLIGRATPIGEQVFVQIIGGDGFYLVDSDFLNFIPRTDDDWRERQLCALSGLDVDTLRVRSGANKGFELRFNPTQATMWRMMKPLEARADATRIESLLDTLQQVRISRFVSDDPAADLETFGLQNPELEILFLKDTNHVIGMQIGASPTNDSSQVYARRHNESTIVLVPKEPFEQWRGSYSDFRDRRIIGSALAARVDTIEVRGQDRFELQRQKNGWKVVAGGETFPADANLVDELFARLSTVEVKFEKDVVADFASFGLAEPQLEYSLNSSTNTPPVLAQIAFGTTQPGSVFVHRSGETSVNSLHAREFELLPRASWQLHDRRIWNFESSNVVAITIRQKGEARRLVRNTRGEWTIAPGSQGIINPFSIEEGLHRLGQLSAVYWAARDEQDRSRFGFSDADHRLVLDISRNGKQEQIEIEFGGLSEFQYPYAAVEISGERRVFEFPWPLYYDFVQRDFSIMPLQLPRVK